MPPDEGPVPQRGCSFRRSGSRCREIHHGQCEQHRYHGTPDYHRQYQLGGIKQLIAIFLIILGGHMRSFPKLRLGNEKSLGCVLPRLP